MSDAAPEHTPRTVIVTGAGSGIGQATARRFVELGDHVVAADLNVGGAPSAALAEVLDVRDEAGWATLVARTLERTGRIDVLCNNAGIGSTADAVDCTPEEWDRVFAVNAKGTFLGTRAVLPAMRRQGSGVIVNTSSVAAMVGLRNRAAYCASKGAVQAFTKQVAVQEAGTGVRCSCVCPGTVDSPWVGRLLDEADDPVAARAALVARQPVGRLGTPEEVARAIEFLADPAVSFATGTALVIDGGLTAG